MNNPSNLNSERAFDFDFGTSPHGLQKGSTEPQSFGDERTGATPNEAGKQSNNPLSEGCFSNLPQIAASGGVQTAPAVKGVSLGEQPQVADRSLSINEVEELLFAQAGFHEVGGEPLYEHSQASTRPQQAQLAAKPLIYTMPKTLAACKRIKKASREERYALVFSAAQMNLLSGAISMACDDAILALSEEPQGHDEIQPYVDAYNELFRVLRAAKAAKSYPNENWRGGEL